MNTHALKGREDRTRTGTSPERAGAGPDGAVQLVDLRGEARAQRGLWQVVREGPQAQRLAAYQRMADRSSRVRENRTGLPDALKSGIENLSGFDMSDVEVHFNSPRPAELGARAYARGTDIHVGPGQERHLAHEAWHVVQQKQGRVSATAQMKGIDINDDDALEREADRMGAEALRAPARTPGDDGLEAGAPIRAPVVQGLLDWAVNLAHNKRKVGVEITETNAGGNQVSGLTPKAAWGRLGAGAQAALWTHNVNLTNAAGAPQAWQVAAAGTVYPAYFAPRGGKSVWMKWGTVSMTEDYGDFEWITRHPDTPMGVTHYRDQLAAVNTARQTVRNGLNALGLAGPYVLALNANPRLGEVFYMNPVAGTTAASSQITFESSDRAKTKKGLLEGLTHGLERRNVPNRASLVDPDPGIAAAVTTAAGRVVVAGVDMELIMAYLIGDVCHKIATLHTGPAWAGAIAANFKQWRTLFPKSHPSQIMFQAMDAPPAPLAITALHNAIAAQSAAIVGDITGLFASKMTRMRVEWAPGAFTPASDPHGRIQGGLAPAAPLPVGGLATLQADVVAFCAANGLNIATEFTRALTALTDYTGTAVDVVRSTGFATHTGGNKGFAFEDRAEVATDFPALTTTYDRIKLLVNRY